MQSEKYSAKVSSVKINNFEVGFAVEFTNDNMAKLPSEVNIQNIILYLSLINNNGYLIHSDSIMINTISKDKFSYIHKFRQHLSNASDVKEVQLDVIGGDANISFWNESVHSYSPMEMLIKYEPQLINGSILPQDYIEPVLDPYTS